MENAEITIDKENNSASFKVFDKRIIVDINNVKKIRTITKYVSGKSYWLFDSDFLYYRSAKEKRYLIEILTEKYINENDFKFKDGNICNYKMENILITEKKRENYDEKKIDIVPIKTDISNEEKISFLNQIFFRYPNLNEKNIECVLKNNYLYCKIINDDKKLSDKFTDKNTKYDKYNTIIPKNVKMKNPELNENTYYIVKISDICITKISINDIEFVLNDKWNMTIGYKYIRKLLNSDVCLHVKIMERKGDVKEKETDSVDHNNWDRFDNRRCNIYYEDQAHQNANRGKNSHQENAQELPEELKEYLKKEGVTDPPKYVYYCSENVPRKDGSTYKREYLRIEEHPLMKENKKKKGKSLWSSSKSIKISIVDKYKETLKKLDELLSNEVKENQFNLPLYVSLNEENRNKFEKGLKSKIIEAFKFIEKNIDGITEKDVDYEITNKDSEKYIEHKNNNNGKFAMCDFLEKNELMSIGLVLSLNGELNTIVNKNLCIKIFKEKNIEFIEYTKKSDDEKKSDNKKESKERPKRIDKKKTYCVFKENYSKEKLFKDFEKYIHECWPDYKFIFEGDIIIDSNGDEIPAVKKKTR